MGILANHVPSVEALKAGVVEVIEDAGSQSKKWFSKSRCSLEWSKLGME
jgi:F0F1-type ATP synthase epsilon subunit